jgi:hypothetical protein
MRYDDDDDDDDDDNCRQDRNCQESAVKKSSQNFTFSLKRLSKPTET